MTTEPNSNILVGTWTYRSFLNDPDLSTQFNNLEFGRGNIQIEPAPMNEFKGRIYDVGWQLDLKGSTTYGNPFTVRFQGTGVVGGEEWIYDYEGYVIRPWPNGINQRMAIVGTIVRTIPHSSGTGGTAPAGVVCSWIAVKQDAPVT
ncbi:MAG TPA: hypothetical protein VKB86_05385 [Pyrinomonadaceae bacterium]|nr:hypothetical protein [Pyrinomonadaceae bacterium]